MRIKLLVLGSFCMLMMACGGGEESDNRDAGDEYGLTEGLKYNLDYSTIGTQSCNGRIPVKGQKTIYLGFENERMRYNNYVWLEVISSMPKTDYVREVYRVSDGEKL